MRSRLTAKVHEITLELRRRLHEPIVSQGKWLGAVLRGHYAYYGVPTNIEALDVFRSEFTHRGSSRFGDEASAAASTGGGWIGSRNSGFLVPALFNPWPQQRFAVRT